MASRNSTLLGCELVARDTAAFRFSRPAGFQYTPGQTIALTLPGDASGAAPLKHTFSLVSAPHEDTLCIATRLREASAYKQALRRLLPRSPIILSGPHGHFGLPSTTGRTLVLVAGGIGITPYMSMLREATHQGSPQRFVLLYANRHAEDAAFLDELRMLTRQNPYLRFLPTLTGSELGDWKGLRGRIDATLMRQALHGLSEPLCYVTGTPGLVDDLRDVLSQLGVADGDVRSEGFHGY